MDALFLLHLTFILFFLSVPFWPIKYLRYGVFTPLALATVWIVFDGCPLTFIQRDLNDEYFSRVLLKFFIPDITNETTSRFSYYILIFVTVVGFVRLCPNVILKK